MLAALLGILLCWALVPIPNLDSPVVDQAAVFSAGARQSLESELRSYSQTGKAQIQVLTVPTLDGEAIEDFSIRVAEAWKIGDAKKGNGILVILVTQDRKSRIEVGDGLEGDLTDVQAKRILAEISRPFFQRGEYEAGLRAAVLTVMDQLSGKVSLPTEEVGQRRSLKRLSDRMELFLFIIFLVFLGFQRLFGRRSLGRRGSSYGAWGTGVGSGWGAGSGGWGSGGGGWSGGGGGFSGGGSSDSW